jgi:gliding motility-associated-like protein
MKRLLFISLVFLTHLISAQEHEWANSFLAKRQIDFRGIDIDSNGNSYAIGNYYRDSFFADTFAIRANDDANGFISKIDSDGNVKWIRTIYLKNSISNNLNFTNVRVLTNNRILACGDFYAAGNSTQNKVLKISQNDSIVANAILTQSRVTFAILYDSMGNLLNYQKLIDGRSSILSTNGSSDKDKDNNVYIAIGLVRGFIYNGSDSIPYDFGATQSVVLKYSPNLDSLLWIKNITNNVGFYFRKLKIGKDNNLYLPSNILGNSSVEIDSVTYNTSDVGNKGFLIILSPSGDIIHKGFVNQEMNQGDILTDVDAIDTNRIFVLGVVKDTLVRNNIQYFTPSPLPPDVTPHVSQITAFPYIGEISTQSTKWIKLTQKKIATSTTFTTNINGQSILVDRFGYAYAILMNNNNFSVNIGGLTDSINSMSGSYSPYVSAKFDSLGNALWLRAGVVVADMQVDLNSDLIYCGSYGNDSLFLNPFTLPFSQGSSGFIAKITDYSITRGEVSSGPYCAGDTFLVPYTKMGEYDTANFFIAELSDENGNFEGGERELGRIKATEDSTIIGQLPLFQVASSPNYRIRIRSTHPPVQSFFRRDSLRLLIYSRDKANPGPPETVCFGDSFRLNTFGGTAWEWSPNYRMNNPNARSPLIYPDRDTIFRIIISDSSGCGDPDTAFKQIFIRPKVQIQTQNVVNACWGLPVNLAANFTQGDSSQYRWTWFNSDSSLWAPLQSDSFRTKDTFTFNYPQSNDTIRFALVLQDDCQTLKDTALITVRLSPNRISSILSTQDSVICYQSQQNLIADLSGGDSATYQWKWFEVDALGEFNFLKEDSLRFSDTLQVQLRTENKEFQRYALVSNDNCIPFFDTAYLNVNINQHQPQVGILPSDTAICPSTEVELVGQVNNGSALGYAFIWLDETNSIQQSDTGFSPQNFSSIPDFSGGQIERMYRLIAQDLCSPNADTTEVRITPRAPLKAIPNTFDTTVCSGAELSLSASGLGGDSSNYQYQWILNNNIISSDSDVGFIPPIDPSPFTLQLVLTDNCMPQNDTAEVVIRVKPALRGLIVPFDSVQDTISDNWMLSDVEACSGSELRFVAKAFGGDSTNYSFEWLLNDSLIGTDSDVMVRLSNHHPSPSTLHLVSKDGCTVPNDTTSVTINILPPLSVTLRHSKGDTLCSGEESIFFAQATGGDSTNYSFEWLLNDSLIGTDSNVMVRLSNHHPSPSTIQLVLSDGCSSPNDTFVHEIYIRPALALDLAASTPCANPTTNLTANPSGGNPDNYVIQWFDEAENMLGEGLSIEVTPTKLTTYKAILTDGCSADSASTQIQIDLIPSILELTASPTEGCEPLEIEFEINTNYQDSFSGILYISDTDSMILRDLFGRIAIRPNAIRPNGIYTPSFKFISKLGCTVVSQNTPTITVHPKPTASFFFSPEEPDLDNSLVQFRNLSTGANSYIWNISPFGESTDFEPQYNYTDSGFHPVQLIAISDQDCKDTAQGQVYIRTNYRVFIPNAFSPNDDGLNDVFQPSIKGIVSSDFKVFNRWGELVFQSTDNRAWDGTYGGKQAPEGIYMYMLSVVNNFGERQFFKGTVALVR